MPDNMSKSESIAKIPGVQLSGAGRRKGAADDRCSFRLKGTSVTGTLLAPHGVRINRKCPECLVGMGLARLATIGPTNGLVVLLVSSVPARMGGRRGAPARLPFDEPDR